MLSRLLLVAVFIAGLSTSLSAQTNNIPHSRQQMQQMQQHQMLQAAAQPKEVQGVIAGVMRGGIVLTDTNNKSGRVAIPATAKVEVTGTAGIDYLQTGLLVEFKGEIDDRGALKEHVDKLAVVTADKLPGFFPPDSTADQGGLAAGAGSELGGKPAKRAKSPASKGAPAAGSYRIVGKLTVGHGGKFSVHVGRTTLPLELSEQPAIAVDSSDYSVAAQGDKVTVKGIMVATKSGPVFQAAEVKIELAEPLASVKKKTPAKPDAKHAVKRPKKADEGLPEPAAEK